MYTDPTGHCIDGCVIEAFAVLTVFAFITAYVYTKPEMQELGEQFAENYSANLEDAVEGVTALFAKKSPKPLTQDEKEKVEHLTEDLEGFLGEHPDLAEEVERKANGGDLDYDHPGEMEQYMDGVNNDMEHLENVRKF